MATEPNIVRAEPEGPVTRPEHPIPVVARIRWVDGPMMDVPGIARSWTREAVEVTWEWPADVRIAKVVWRRDRQPPRSAPAFRPAAGHFRDASRS